MSGDFCSCPDCVLRFLRCSSPPTPFSALVTGPWQTPARAPLQLLLYALVVASGLVGYALVWLMATGEDTEWHPGGPRAKPIEPLPPDDGNA